MACSSKTSSTYLGLGKAAPWIKEAGVAPSVAVLTDARRRALLLLFLLRLLLREEEADARAEKDVKLECRGSSPLLLRLGIRLWLLLFGLELPDRDADRLLLFPAAPPAAPPPAAAPVPLRPLRGLLLLLLLVVVGGGVLLVLNESWSNSI